MEVYVSYIVGTSISAFLGNMAYTYIYAPEKVDDNENSKSDSESTDIEYNLVDSKLNEREVNSVKDKKPLGATFKEKMESLQQILRIECRRDYPINNTRKVRSRWLRYIKEYEKIGHSEFVFNHTTKPYKSK
tara:strand:+ start:2962 stop:3357 length:396 start_codon:yes stop_codon:yes gene_type:complete